MKTNEIIKESEQLEELGLKDIGKGIGKTVGAVGTGIGGIKGAYQGAKDAYSASRDKAAAATQKTIGKAGGAKYPKVVQSQPTQTTAATPTSQSTEVANQVKTLRTQAATLNKQADALEKSQPTSTTAPTTATVDKIAQGIEAPSAGNTIANTLKGIEDAWKHGTHTPLGGSLVPPDKGEEKNLVTITDRTGKPIRYNKVGTQWVDANGAPITDPAIIAMLDQQAKNKAADTATTATPAPTTKPAKQLSQTPDAIRKRQARAAAKTGPQPTATTTPTTVGPGVMPQMTAAPGKVTYNMPAAKPAAAAPAPTVAPPTEPITIGGQKILPSDPAYAKIMKGYKEPAVTESLFKTLWGKK